MVSQSIGIGMRFHYFVSAPKFGEPARTNAVVVVLERWWCGHACAVATTAVVAQVAPLPKQGKRGRRW